MPQVTSQQTSPRADRTHTASDLTSTELPAPRSGNTSEVRASIMLASSQKTAQEQQKADRIETAIGAGVIYHSSQLSSELFGDSRMKVSDLDFLSITTRDKLLQKAEELGLIPDALTHPLSNETNLKKIDAANKELLQIVKAEEQFRKDLERMKEKSLIPPDALTKILAMKDPVARNQALEPYRKLEEVRSRPVIT